ncbi:YkvA family protein [Pseudomonas sp. sp1636]|uniref:YkvA family protein n=1 Tax=Pseudomonas sp. sp1636 TaxID=3036707 RepID=UPI0025A552E7|nr:YkvA family protein [Pseudomonas sp. sp1636]MDM8347781.1 YkvA family protein [Pseudomonas sp. sp1636]
MKQSWRFSSYLRLAQAFLRRGRLPALLLAVARKSATQGRRVGALKEDLRLLQGLCMAWWRGEYRAISSQALLAVVAALLYFVTPLDGLPDWLPVLGFIDDLAVLAWVLRTWSDELAAFRAWREAQAPEALEVIERLPDR